MTTNPWKTRSSRAIYSNPWFSVREDQVLRPDGQEGIYAVVEKGLAVGVLALDQSLDVYLVGQYRYPTERYSWEIIEGGAEPGETSLQTAKRELKEEAGLIAHSWAPLGGDFQLSNCICTEIGNLFVATDLETTQAEPEGTEVLQLRKVSLSDALAMVESGEIQDTLSVIALLLYRYKLR